jgi:hypothetical protein
LVFNVPKNVSAPVFLKTPVGFYVVGLAEAKSLQKEHKANLNGQKFGKFTDGTRTWRACYPVFLLRSMNESCTSLAGESARMTPSRPTHGNTWAGGYARRLSGFVSGWPEAVRLFKAWRNPKLAPLDEETRLAVAGRAVLYMPSDGKNPRRGVDAKAQPKREIRRNDEGTLEILDGGTWVLIAAADAHELIAEGRAVAVN